MPFVYLEEQTIDFIWDLPVETTCFIMAAKCLLPCAYDSPAFFMEICEKQVENKSVNGTEQMHKLS